MLPQHSTKNQAIIYALFDQKLHADLAIRDLGTLGLRSDAISIVGKNGFEQEQRLVEDAERSMPRHMTEIEERFARNVSAGTKTGAIIGGIAGLIVSVGAVAIPSVGTVMVSGPAAVLLGMGIVGATASGAVTGAVAGGIVGVFSSMGIAEERARYFADEVREGSTLLILQLNANDPSADDIEAILRQNQSRYIERHAPSVPYAEPQLQFNA